MCALTPKSEKNVKLSSIVFCAHITRGITLLFGGNSVDVILDNSPMCVRLWIVQKSFILSTLFFFLAFLAKKQILCVLFSRWFSGYFFYVRLPLCSLLFSDHREESESVRASAEWMNEYRPPPCGRIESENYTRGKVRPSAANALVCFPEKKWKEERK